VAAERMPARVSVAAAGLFAALVLQGAAPIAVQGQTQRVYIVSLAANDDLESVSARVGAAARVALRQIEGVDWQGPDRAFLGYSEFMVERMARARERLAEGRQAYLDLDLDRAMDQLAGAVEDFDAGAGALEDPGDLGEALLYLSASQAVSGRARDARRTFQRLHVQMPHIQPDPNLFNPDIVRMYEQAAPRDRNNPAASITIESEPAGAIAYVDYVARGRTPLRVDGLMAGVHNVRVSRPGAGPFVQQLSLSRGGTEQVNAFLEDQEATAGLADSVGSLITASMDELGGPISEIALALSLDKVGIIRVSAGEGPDQVQLELFMFDVGRGVRILRMHGPAPAAIGELEASVQRLVAGALQAALSPQQAGDGGEIVIGPGGATTQQQTTGPTNDGEGGSLLESPWLWVGIGAAVVLGVVLTVVLASSGDELGAHPGGQVILEF